MPGPVHPAVRKLFGSSYLRRGGCSDRLPTLRTTRVRMTLYIFRTVVLFVALAAAGCASYRPTPLDQIPFQARAETLEERGLRVTVSVLSREEAKQAFGVNLQKRGIQPIWIEIENRIEKPFWFMMAGLDPNYFSAHEAAYMNHYRFGGQQNRQMDAYFADLSFDQRIMPGETNSGFAFTNETLGAKQIRVKLYSNKDVRTFEFFISVPGVVSDWDRGDLEALVKGADVHVETELELRAAIEALPCCTQRADGTGEGDPLNIALLGGLSILKAFIRSGWDETAFQRDFSSLFGAAYLYGRPPDVQFQKARRRVDSVNLVRLWVTPIHYRGNVVVVGSIARSIDPNVDEAVQYVLEDLATAESVRRYGLAGGIGVVSREAPRQNFARAPYWTDGNRMVLEITDAPVRLDQIDMFEWDGQRRIRVQPGP